MRAGTLSTDKAQQRELQAENGRNQGKQHKEGLGPEYREDERVERGRRDTSGQCDLAPSQALLLQMG